MTQFSIVVPTYNRSQRLAKTIQSVLDQKFGDYELIIVDDGSTDNSNEVVGTFHTGNIKYIYKENEERAIARNVGIDAAEGEYVTFLDSDDILYPNYLKEAHKLIEQHNDPEWLHISYEIRTESGNIIRQENRRRGHINRSLVTGNHLSCLGVFVRKDILSQCRFNEDPAIIGSEDYLLWLELASRYPLHYSNEISAYMVQHNERSVINFDCNQLIDRVNATISSATGNKSVSHFLDTDEKKFIAHRYLYLSNHLSRASSKLKSLRYFLRAIANFPRILFHRNSFAYLKSLVLLK